MDLTARDIHEKQFHDSWRGYNQEEVDEFLDRLADVLDRLQRENSALNARVTELDHAVSTSRDTEEMLKKTLITAQQAAEEAIANAKARAEALIQDAEERTRQVHREADEKLQSADAEARRKSLEADREHTIRKREIDTSLEKLRRFESDLKRRLAAFLTEQTRALERLTEEEPPRYEPVQHEAGRAVVEGPYDDAPPSAIEGGATEDESPPAKDLPPAAEGGEVLEPSAQAHEPVQGDDEGEQDGDRHQGHANSEPTGSWIPDFVASKESSDEDGTEGAVESGIPVRSTDIASLYATGELSAAEPEGRPSEEAAEVENDTVTLDDEETAPAHERSRALFWRNDS